MSLEDFSFGFLSRHRRTAISAPFSFFADFIIRDYLELERFFFCYCRHHCCIWKFQRKSKLKEKKIHFFCWHRLEAIKRQTNNWFHLNRFHSIEMSEILRPQNFRRIIEKQSLIQLLLCFIRMKREWENNANPVSTSSMSTLWTEWSAQIERFCHISSVK